MKLITTLILLGLFLVSAYAQVPQKIEGTRIQDFAQVLSPEQEAQLQAKTDQLKASKDIELGIILVNTTNGVAPVDYTTAVGRQFGIGSAEGEHRGIVFLLAISDRQCFIQPSRHISGVYIDSKMSSICRSMRPQLRASDYNGALLNGTDQLIALSSEVDQQQAQGIASDPKPATTSSGHGGIIALFFLGGLFVVGLIVAATVLIRRRNERLEREREEAEQAERQRRREAARKLQEEQERKEREAHEAWLKTPEGIADTKRKEEARQAAEKLQREREQRAREERERKAREYAIWAATPAGIAAIALEKKQRQEREKREAEERAAQQKREREEEAERARQRKRQQEEDDDRRKRSDSPSFGSTWTSTTNSDSGNGFSGGFGGGSDFGGGGGGDSW